MAAKSVLIVDDEPDVRTAYKDILKEEGCKVTTVANGAACLKELRARAEKYGLVVLDVLLPEQTGYDVLEVIRANWPDLPVVLMSGKVDKLTREALDTLGAKEFLEKPVPPELLVKTVEKHLKK